MYLSFQAIREKMQGPDILFQESFPQRFKNLRYLDPQEELQKDTLYICTITEFSLHNHRIEEQSFIIVDDLGLHDKIDISKRINAFILTDKPKQLLRLQEFNRLFTESERVNSTLQQFILDDMELNGFWDRLSELLNLRVHVKQNQQVLYSNGSATQRSGEEKIEKSFTIADIRFELTFFVPHDFTQYQREILEQLEPLFFQVLKRYTASFEPMEKKMSKIILNLLQSTTPAVRPLEDTIWEGRETFQVYVATLPENQEFLTKKLSEIDNVSILAMPISESYLVVYAKEGAHDWTKDIEKFLQKQCSIISKSHPFIHIEELQMQWKNLYYHLKYLQEIEKKGMTCIGEDTVALLASKYKEYAGVGALIHDIIRELYNQEDRESMDLLETLYVYLKHERSYLKTSKELELHRNSIVYRINKLTTKYDVDLEDPYLRQQLLISYQLLSFYEQ